MAIIIGTAWLLVATTTFADTHYVDINSTNPIAPYTSWESSTTSIQDAVDIAENGDTVLIGDGTYNVTSQIEIRTGLTVRSVNGCDKTIVDANGNCRVFRIIITKTDRTGPVVVEGFTMTGGDAIVKSNAIGGGITVRGSAPIKIADCIVEANDARWGGGIYFEVGTGEHVSAVVENCIIRNNRAKNSGGGVNVALREKATSEITIQNCNIYSNSAEVDGGGVCVFVNDKYPENKVINCTIVWNRALNYGGAKNIDIYNSIIYGNSTPDIGGEQKKLRVFNSCSPSIDRSHTGNVGKKPRFVNAKRGDYRLQPDSPCIDAGSNIHTNQATDLDGNPRIMDGDRDGDAVVDMGAYEFQITNVEIDIKPGSKSKSINLKAGGLLPVAILTTGTFDASTVDPASVRFAEAAPERRVLQDVDADGDVDLLLQFQRRRLKLGKGSTKALLTGETKDGRPFIGGDAVTVLPPR
ncbi:choice-of-anchor Q domain-containing protein [Pontiella sulfatireligans]|uniref:choice-of-anchor Q domain-containing protein n=1 Tax=Pontiella sulfatireligans TaxID=2750658 RepID=UPI00109CDD3F|nr:choice-of-anchor Q domain-containing protein [Pontiella sulfatireligans]